MFGIITQVILIVSLASLALAEPFLVADAPDPAQQITSYEIYQDNVLTDTFDGEVLHYDLASVTPGAYNWTAKACNVWGCSEVSDPFLSPLAPTPPLNINAIR